MVSTIFSCGWLHSLKSLFSKLVVQGHRTGSFSSSSFIYKRGRKSLISQWERQKFKLTYYPMIFHDEKYLNSFLPCGFHNVLFINKPVLYLSKQQYILLPKENPNTQWFVKSYVQALYFKSFSFLMSFITQF